MGQAELEVGARVVVRGTKMRDDLNGREGVVVVGTVSNRRWEVRLEGQAKHQPNCQPQGTSWRRTGAVCRSGQRRLRPRFNGASPSYG